MTFRVMGIDPGLTRCGVGIVDIDEKRRLSYVNVSVITSDPDRDLAERIGLLGNGLEKILEQYHPNVVAIERVFAQQNVSTVMGTAQLSGVAMFLASNKSIPVFFHTPSEVKAAVTGYGSADKTQVTAMVTKILDLAFAPKPADAADALALAICHAWKSRNPLVTVKKAFPDKFRPASAQTPAQKAWREAESRSKRSEL